MTIRPGAPELIVAEANRLFVDALALALVDCGYRVRATATTRGELLRGVLAHRPHVCVLDLHLLDGRAVDVITLIHRYAPEVRVLALSRDPDPMLVTAAMEAGSAGYLSKDKGIDALDQALGRVLAGELFIEPALALETIRHTRSRRDGPSEPFRWLTPRELEVLRRLTEGDGTVEIAHALGMTTNTARTHVQSVLDKLGVHSRLEAVALANRLRVELRAG
ncbi:LuxR C-terminal-related transcriptional regulator [Streptacidiphilus carbonis]|uniref:LuxR C-terminal-related transcriptional regulator n=1 Tax=Streptacidiphilus carbonis TaxID=105422 RepID=UPI0005A667B5|nr:response regulator transcription factor [Streptacidiphilus carbonis]